MSDVPSFTEYSKGHPGSFTVAGNIDFYPYLARVYDPIQPAYVAGHGRGMSQDGTLRWERGNTNLDSVSGIKYPFWNRDQILAHYYTSVQLRHANGAVYWGEYRWNALSIDRDVFRTWTTDGVRVVVQNTGTLDWELNTKLSAYWQRCTSSGCSSYLQAADSRPQQLIPNADSVVPGSHQVYMNGDLGVVMYLKPPADLYQGKDYGYFLRFDLRHPNGNYYANWGWHEQLWRVFIQNKPPAPRPSPPPCPPNNCPTPQRSATVSWIKDPNPDDVTFVWKQSSPSGVVTGETANTALTVNLERGENTITVKARDNTEFETESDEVVVGRFLYDPDKPTIASFAPLPEWSNASSLNLTWSAGDVLSGIADYTLEQQINGGAWTTVVATTQATNYQVTNLLNNNDYTFRLTVRDKAGNIETATRTVKIDRDPPSSMVTVPTGTLTKTWTILRWTSSFNRAPITGFAIDRLVNGTWQTLYPLIEPTSSFLLFEGQPNTTYALRIRAVDAAGNQQPASPNAHITFTTGTDSSGLFKFYLPILLKDGTVTNLQTVNSTTTTNTTTNAYPLPGQ